MKSFCNYLFVGAPRFYIFYWRCAFGLPSITQNLKYFDANSTEFLRIANAVKPKVFRFEMRKIVVWAKQQELDVAELQTSGYGNNCLWFSTQLAMGKFTVQDQHSTEQQEASRRGRTRIHSELQRAWPLADKDAEGPTHSWSAGNSRARIKRIYRSQDMMVEAHVFALPAGRRRRA